MRQLHKQHKTLRLTNYKQHTEPHQQPLHRQDVLALHQNDLHALVALDNEVPEEETDQKFQFRDIFQKSVLHPFLVILVLMVLLQFSGQGAITFFTVQIFSVSAGQG